MNARGYTRADVVEVVINDDGDRLWVNLRVDGEGPPVNELRIANIQRLLVLDDRYTFPLADLVEYMYGEIAQLRLNCGQWAEQARRDETDGAYERRHAEANRAKGRKEALLQVEQELLRICNEYRPRDRVKRKG